MEERITAISLFLITNLIIGFAYFQWGLDWGAILYGDSFSVPMIVLSFGPFIQILVLLMVNRYLEVISARARLFPRLIVPKLDTEKLSYSWEKGSAIVVLGFPFVSFGYFWIRFFGHRLGVWNSATMETVGVFEQVSFTLFFGHWNDYRYGSLQSFEGSSFVPFWQPIIIMGGGTAIVLVLTIFILTKVVYRIPTRRRVSRRTK